MNNEEYSSEEMMEDVKENDISLTELAEKLGVLKKKNWQRQMEQEQKQMKKEMKKLRSEVNMLRNKVRAEPKAKTTEHNINIQITKTDIILFRYLFENNFLTRKQIGKYIYTNLSYANQRLCYAP